jgi:hypothetical protein
MLAIMLNLDGFLGGRAGAVDDCNDDNKSNCIDSGKLGELCCFEYMAESIRGRDGDCGLKPFWYQVWR